MVGSWHIRPHVPECLITNNPAYKHGLGLSFGDSIEHIWADVRPYWFTLAYMSHAARVDFLSKLVSAHD